MQEAVAHPREEHAIDTEDLASDIEILDPEEHVGIPLPVKQLVGTTCNICGDDTLRYVKYKGTNDSAFCPTCDTPIMQVF